jgi:mannose/fructose/N-acetylgalactosamine-specific phosphotransferase system component IID
MIPLSYFLITWTILLAIFGVVLLLTLVQMLKHGLSRTGTYVSTFIFLVVTAGVVIWTAFYLSSVDWSIGIKVIPDGIPGFSMPAEEGVTL